MSLPKNTIIFISLNFIMTRLFVFILFEMAGMVYYLGGDGNYSENNPGNNLNTCLNSNDRTCLIKNNYSKSFGDTTLNSGDALYTLDSTTPIPENYFTLGMEGSFTFTVGNNRNIDIKNLHVYSYLIFIF
jgi:hypothetical protein